MAYAVPAVGAAIGIGLADKLFGITGESRSGLNMVMSATLAVIGMSLGLVMVGTGAGAVLAGAIATGAITTPTITTFAAVGAAAVAGTALGSVAGVALGDTLTRKR